ncbi:MAG: hypothetical protein QOJ07_1996 [Thermoleophilaceae bacterium]|nr:hypothetical protein [Thermoleophilaceae bacterium]
MNTPAPFRLLVVSNETAASEVLHDTIEGLAGGRAAEVTVLAPALNGRLRHLVSDEDRARAAAKTRVDHCLAQLAERGIVAGGRVGDADPLVAIADVLRTCPVDELLIATHPESRSNWLAHGLVERAVLCFGLPTAHLVVGRAAENAERADRRLIAA